MISIIIPIYQAERYLHMCLDSIFRQTYADFEVILVDDGSTDSSGAICEACKAKDPRIHVIHQTNQGQAAARNHAIKIAKGEWVCFVDSDDLIHPNMLKSLLHAAIETGSNISACDRLEAATCPDVFMDSKQAHYETITIDESAIENLYREDSPAYWCVWAKLIRRGIVEKLPFTEGRFYEDNAVMCQWLAASEKICITDSQLYFYRVNPDGTTKSQFSLKQVDYLWALQEQIEFYKSNGFTAMETIVAGRYLADAKWIHQSVVNQLHDSALGETITHQMREIYLRYRKKLSWEKWRQEEMDLFLFPGKKMIYKAKHAGSRVKRFFKSKK